MQSVASIAQTNDRVVTQRRLQCGGVQAVVGRLQCGGVQAVVGGLTVL